MIVKVFSNLQNAIDRYLITRMYSALNTFLGGVGTNKATLSTLIYFRLQVVVKSEGLKRKWKIEKQKLAVGMENRERHLEAEEQRS